MDILTNKRLGELIQSIAQGNVSAISEIYELLGKVMYAVANIYVSQLADVEDIIHEALLKIVRKAKKFRENKNAYSWINTIVKNTAKDFVRQNRYQEKVFHTESATYEFEENGIIIKEAFLVLTNKEQDLLTYVYWYGLSYSEIGEILHISKSAVKKRIDKALEKIRNFYEK